MKSVWSLLVCTLLSNLAWAELPAVQPTPPPFNPPNAPFPPPPHPLPPATPWVRHALCFPRGVAVETERLVISCTYSTLVPANNSSLPSPAQPINASQDHPAYFVMDLHDPKAPFIQQVAVLAFSRLMEFQSKLNQPELDIVGFVRGPLVWWDGLTVHRDSASSDARLKLFHSLDGVRQIDDFGVSLHYDRNNPNLARLGCKLGTAVTCGIIDNIQMPPDASSGD